MCVVAEVEVAEVDQAQDLAWLDFGFPMSPQALKMMA